MPRPSIYLHVGGFGLTSEPFVDFIGFFPNPCRFRFLSHSRTFCTQSLSKRKNTVYSYSPFPDVLYPVTRKEEKYFPVLSGCYNLTLFKGVQGLYFVCFNPFMTCLYFDQTNFYRFTIDTFIVRSLHQAISQL